MDLVTEHVPLQVRKNMSAFSDRTDVQSIFGLREAFQREVLRKKSFYFRRGLDPGNIDKFIKPCQKTSGGALFYDDLIADVDL